MAALGSASKNPWVQAGATAAGIYAANKYGKGQVVQSPQMPQDIQGLRSNISNWLNASGQTPNGGAQNPFGAINQQGQSGPVFSNRSGTPTFATQPQANSGNPGVPTVPQNHPGFSGVAPNGAMQVPSGGDSWNSANPLPGLDTSRALPGGRPHLALSPEALTAIRSGPGIPGQATSAASGFDGIFANGWQPAQSASAGGVDIAAVPNGPQTTVGPVGHTDYNPTQSAGALDYNKFLDPRFNDAVAQILGGVGMGGGGVAAPVVRGVEHVGSVADMVKSLNEIVNSQAGTGLWKDDIMSPYQALFKQQNDMALAQAKEQSGNLTGSGYAANLGNVAGRAATEQGAKLADMLTNLATIEQGKQYNVAGLEQNKNFQNQNVELQRALADAANGTQAGIAGAQIANQSAIARLGQVGDLAKIFNNSAMDQAKRGDTVNMFNTDQTNQSRTQQAIANAQAETQRAVAQGQIDSSNAQTYFNALVKRNTDQATLDQNNNQFNAGQWNVTSMFNNQQATNLLNSNSARYLQLLLGMAGTGVGPGTQAYQPGWGDSLAQVLPYLGQLFGNKAGSNSSPVVPPTAAPATPTNTPNQVGFQWSPYRPWVG